MKYKVTHEFRATVTVEVEALNAEAAEIHPDGLAEAEEAACLNLTWFAPGRIKKCASHKRCAIYKTSGNLTGSIYELAQTIFSPITRPLARWLDKF